MVSRRCITIIDGRHLIINTPHSVVDVLHSIVDAGYPSSDGSHSIVNDKHVIRNFPYPMIDIPPQELRIRHSSLLSLPSIFSASSISVFPISFSRYFSEGVSISGNLFAQQ